MVIGKSVRVSLSYMVGSSICFSTHNSVRELVSHSIWDLVNPSVHNSVIKVCNLARFLLW